MSYLIPSEFTRHEIIFQNSHFITSIQHTPELHLAQAFIRQIRQEMPNASHHVYAFKVGYGASITEGMSDDGEPPGTAGPPSLAVLRGSEIGDITLVTTRFFGGKKLGTGGLVKAYTESAQLAIAQLQTERKIARCQLRLGIEYSNYNHIKYQMDRFDLVIDEESFTTDVSVLITIAQTQKSQFIEELTEMTSGRVKIEEL